MRKVIDWCNRHFVVSIILFMFVPLAIGAGIIFTLYTVSPEPAAAKPVKPTTPTVSCAEGYSSDYQNRVSECKVTLKDGRTVTCVKIYSGTSCDWDHATAKKGK